MKLQLTRPEATAFDPKQSLAAFATLPEGIKKTELMMAGESRRARWRFLLSPERGGSVNESAIVTSDEPVVYLLDADARVLQALKRLLADAGLTAVPSTTAAAFFESFQPDRVGCLVLDLALGDADGLAIQQEICDRGLTLPVVFLSGCATVPASVRAMKAGALDFLTKPVDFFTLLTAVRAGIALDLVRRAEATEQHDLLGKFETLSTREKELLPYLVSGMLNKQIAGDLGVVDKTVKVHRAHVMAKLGCQSRSDLVRLAERLQINPVRRALHCRPGGKSMAITA